MKTNKKDNHLVITIEETTIESFKENLKTVSGLISQNNTILIFNKNSIFKNKSFSLLLHFVAAYYNNLHSFIIVNKHVNSNDYAEIHSIVPTIEEAMDILELEEIERDLLK